MRWLLVLWISLLPRYAHAKYGREDDAGHRAMTACARPLSPSDYPWQPSRTGERGEPETRRRDRGRDSGHRGPTQPSRAGILKAENLAARRLTRRNSPHSSVLRRTGLGTCVQRRASRAVLHECPMNPARGGEETPVIVAARDDLCTYRQTSRTLERWNGDAGHVERCPDC